MNAKTATEINALSTAALREYAKEIGVKRSATDTKATLAAKVIAAQPVETVEVTAIKGSPAELIELLHEVAAAAEAPKATTVKKPCGICKTRPVSNSQELPLGIKGTMCIPCYDESGWENTHSDQGHDRIAAAIIANEVLSDTDQAEVDVMAACWICRPELNEASATYVPRKGTSRAGMVMNTTHSQAPTTKAQIVAAKAEGKGKVEISASQMNVFIKVTCSAGTLQLAWTMDGAYDYDNSAWTATGSGKTVKVRNVAAALRLIG